MHSFQSGRPISNKIFRPLFFSSLPGRPGQRRRRLLRHHPLPHQGRQGGRQGRQAEKQAPQPLHGPYVNPLVPDDACYR